MESQHAAVQERVLTDSERQAVLNRFGYMVDSGDAPIDAQLAEIRSQLGSELGRPVSLDEPLVRGAWDPQSTQWDRFVFWAARFYSIPRFEQDERDYKLVVAERMSAARNSIRDGEADWFTTLEHAFASPNNILHHITKRQFLDWCRDHNEVALTALQELWESTDEPEHRMRNFLLYLPSEGQLRTAGNRTAIPSVLFAGVDPINLPFFLPTPFAIGYELTGYVSANHSDPVERYVDALAFLDRILDEASTRGLQLRDRLDAQSVLWTVTRWTPGGWEQREHDELQRFRDGLPITIEPELEEDELPEIKDLSRLSDEILIDRSSLQDIQDLLEHRRQAIFFGPPGTGKTYIALKLAEFLAGDPERVGLVQFHAAYAYEDFVEGFRPRAINDSPGFQLEDGPLKRIAEQARQEPDETHVLIIDEINRANIARVFGELYFLLEYRDHHISLQYSSDEFSLPKNLLIIGTMNTADRSIALLDAALRRRFYFIPFFPAEASIAGLLRRWLQRNRSDMHWVADVVDRANELLDDRDGGIGPSYFMREDLDERWVELIWNHQIIPYLEEHFFGAPDRLEDFRLETLRNGASGEIVAEDGLDDGEPPDTA
jgi:5-methylcytosine-specific restriction enzyme B